MLLTTGERISHGAAVHGARRSRHRGDQLHRQPGRHHHRHRAHARRRSSRSRATACARRSAEGKVCVVAGFQGVSTDKEITTLGRGGSDTHRRRRSPQALDADACEIYTDVTGVFTADPRIVPQARKLAHVNFDEMLEMAGAGSKVLALRSVEFARNHNVPLHVRSSLHLGAGHVGHRHRSPTWKTRSSPVSSPTSARRRSPSSPCPTGRASRPRCSSRSPAANVNVDMIVQNTSHDGTTDISFTMPKADMADAEAIVAARRRGDRRRGCRARRRHRQDQPRRRRHEDQPGHRRQDVPRARRRGRQHRDDLARRRSASAWSPPPPTWSAPPARCTPRSVSTRARPTRRRCPSGSDRACVHGVEPGTLVRS